MGIAIHNLSATAGDDELSAPVDLSAAVRQSAGGLLGTSVELADLVRIPTDELKMSNVDNDLPTRILSAGSS